MRMAKAPASDSIMAADKMKPLLALSKREPVNAAIALTSDGDGIILLDKKAKPKKVSAMLKAEAAKAKIQLNTSTLRYGRALVDTDYDSGMVRFFVNKDAPASMRVKLVEVVKKIAYQKVELNVDPAIDEEPEDEGEAQENGAPVPDAAVHPAPEPVPQQAQAPAAPPAPPEAPPPPADMSPFRTELGALIPQISTAAAGDAAKLESLKQLAGGVTLAIRASDPIAAGEALGKLKAAIGQAAPASSAQPVPPAPPAAPQASAPQPSAAPKPAQTGFVTMQKSRLIWDSARKRVATEIQSLKAAVSAEAQGDPNENAVLGALKQLDDVLTNLDERLLDKLDAALSNSDPVVHATLTQDAKAIIGEYIAYTQSNPLVQKLDGDTPFGVKLSVASTMNATLKALQATLR